MKLIYSKNYFNLTKIFVLRLFKMSVKIQEWNNEKENLEERNWCENVKKNIKERIMKTEIEF